MARLSRKDLKHDKFVEEVGHQIEYFAGHSKQVVVTAAIAIAVIVGGVSFYGYQRSQQTKARKALYDAVRLFHGEVSLEERPGFITFTTTGEKDRRVREALDEVVADFGGRDEAVAAEYYLGLLEIEQGKNDDARKRLEKVAGGSEYGTLARLALAELLAGQGDNDAAKKQFEDLIARPSSMVPADRAKLAYARFLADTDPEAAKPLLEELQSAEGPAAGAARRTLQQIQGS